MKNNIIIDIEFNGLPRYNFKPEVTQVKLYNLNNNKQICLNYKTKKKAQLGSLLVTGEINGEKYFSKKELGKALKTIDASVDDNFIGFSTKTDKEILWSYSIELNYNEDLQETLMRSKYERKMAYNGRSMETCYYILMGKPIEVSHNGIEELSPLVEMYHQTRGLRLKKYLTVYPWGTEAGMPLKDYIESFRRRADGYRYNNNDILAESLDHYVEIIEDWDW